MAGVQHVFREEERVVGQTLLVGEEALKERKARHCIRKRYALLYVLGYHYVHALMQRLISWLFPSVFDYHAVNPFQLVTQMLPPVIPSDTRWVILSKCWLHFSEFLLQLLGRRAISGESSPSMTG